MSFYNTNQDEAARVNAYDGPVTVIAPWPVLPGWRLEVAKTDTSPNPVTVQAGLKTFYLTVPHQHLLLEYTKDGWEQKPILPINPT